ncbi:MAG TPA: hypothetical protein VEC36_13795 [Patescibacteria group bacterium]|nr:hypothetical protein [Patescibacteria group bacterium]
MKKLIILFVLFAISCNPFENISEVKKREAALKNPRFKELPEEEMYAFLNEVYLPRIDSFGWPRKIYLYPRKYDDWVSYYNEFHSEEKSLEERIRMLSPSRQYEVDKQYIWKLERLNAAQSVAESEMIYFKSWNSLKTGEEYYQWQKHFEDGFVIISKPLYDSKKNVYIIFHNYINSKFDDVDYSEEFWLVFEKTDAGWIDPGIY